LSTFFEKVEKVADNLLQKVVCNLFSPKSFIEKVEKVADNLLKRLQTTFSQQPFEKVADHLFSPKSLMEKVADNLLKRLQTTF
jgi:hypothetical protein